MKKLMLMLILGIFLVSFASANLGTVKQNDCIDLYQYCDNCTYVNYTAMKFPNGTVTPVNLAMTSNGFNYNYTFCSANVTGDYFYTVCGDKDGSAVCEEISFTVTGGGAGATTASAIMYAIIMFVLLSLFIVSMLWWNSIPWHHYTDQEGNVVMVNSDRFKKIAVFFFAYITLMLLMFTGKAMAQDYMFTNDAPVFFDVFFTLLLYSIVPGMIGFFTVGIITSIADTKVQEMITRFGDAR